MPSASYTYTAGDRLANRPAMNLSQKMTVRNWVTGFKHIARKYDANELLPHEFYEGLELLFISAEEAGLRPEFVEAISQVPFREDALAREKEMRLASSRRRRERERKSA